MIWQSFIFRKNDIRGIYKKDFDLSFVRNLARAFVIYSRGASQNRLKIVLAHDSRLTSPEIARAMQEEFKQLNTPVTFLGLASSPLCFFTSHFFKDITAGIMVTASHNPKNFNGFKFQLDQKSIFGEELLKIKTLLLKNKKNYANSVRQNDKPPRLENFAKTAYVEYLTKKFSKSLKNCPLKLALDFAGGAVGPTAVEVFKKLKISAHFLYKNPDGNFSGHPPDPSEPKNLQILQKTVIKNHYDFGAGFDGDGDRLVIIEKTGRILHGDELMAVLIKHLLPRSSQKKQKVVVDVKCSDWFFGFLKNFSNVQTVISPSGHSLIRQNTLKEQALFGGELSGHFFFRDDFFCIDDGLYTLFRLMSILAKEKKSLEDLLPQRETLETYELRRPVKDINSFNKRLKNLKKYYAGSSAQVLDIDGVRVSQKGAWGLARLSGTQNEATMRFGAETKEQLKALQQEFYKILFS